MDADPETVFWVFFILALMPVAAAAGWLLGGVRRRRRTRELPGLWWVCPACRSVNAPDRRACYACGAPLPDRPETMPTDRDFTIVQRFGPRRPADQIDGVGRVRPGAGSPGDDRPDGSAPPARP